MAYNYEYIDPIYYRGLSNEDLISHAHQYGAQGNSNWTREIWKVLEERDAQKQAVDEAQIRANTESTDPSKIGMNVNAGLKDAQGRMMQPKFQSLLDNSGLLKEQYRLDASKMPQANYDASGLDKVRAQALSNGSSPWAQLQMQKLAQDKAYAMDDLRKGAGKQAQAMGQAKGAGSKERLALMAMQPGQQLQSDYQAKSLDIGRQDQDTKNKLLNLTMQGDQDQFKAGLDNRKFNAGIQKYNIDTALADIAQRRSTDTQNYNENMAAWAANMTGSATAAARPSGGKK